MAIFESAGWPLRLAFRLSAPFNSLLLINARTLRTISFYLTFYSLD
jgi:hypothetical protein